MILDLVNKYVDAKLMNDNALLYTLLLYSLIYTWNKLVQNGPNET